MEKKLLSLTSKNKQKVIVVRSVMIYRYHTVYKLLNTITFHYYRILQNSHTYLDKNRSNKSIYYFADVRLIGILRKLSTLWKYIFLPVYQYHSFVIKQMIDYIFFLRYLSFFDSKIVEPYIIIINSNLD